MRIFGCRRENGLAYQSLVNETSTEEMRMPRNKSKLMPGPRDAPQGPLKLGVQVRQDPRWMQRIKVLTLPAPLPRQCICNLCKKDTKKYTKDYQAAGDPLQRL